MYKSKIKVAIETVKRALAFEDRVSVTKKWRALPFKKKKISPRCFAYNPLLHLTWTREKTC